ncbi:hypothetical protein COEREDRAFT_79702 [Coemansia reversa NRRL 1564]|uniref:BHLH domain-containing protein n=1 Tax=Coemansia reversa (strain ATCC 12441 / NRRL 1564) TaxID=763665 RepID=A0A2G5BIA6_COERN|nr:hypothetical protein COEREDRAFT_79702 [Coemansia reversa NRRL 1564]|eukprot:PIA18702.1 hypothetical protein COEREDRAFT_79702 [Coemansia reversa NRRL 1564]
MNLRHAPIPSGYIPHMIPRETHNMIQYHTNQAHNSNGTSHGIPSCSPEFTCYSSDTSLKSEKTLGNYAVDAHKSSSPVSSKTATPPLQKITATTGAIRKTRKRGPRSQFTAEEKEKRRKISHSAIEKRRRERTNIVLNNLQQIVPWLSKGDKVQKLEILEAAHKYIVELLPKDTTDRTVSRNHPMDLKNILS